MIYKNDKLSKGLREEIDNYFVDKSDGLYKTWFKKKATKGYRQISEPELILKRIQKKIKTLFDDINIHNRFSKSCFGFMPKKNIGDNALFHARKLIEEKQAGKGINFLATKRVPFYGKILNLDNVPTSLSEARGIKMDLSDAFGSITSKLIKEGLIQITSFSKEDIERIVKTCTLKGVLPQGTSTSPGLQNIALDMFDNYLKAILSINIYEKFKIKFNYTRFVDDIVITMDKPGIIHKIIPMVESTARYYDLKINTKKTKIMSSKNGIFITGINIINSSTHLCVSRNYRNQVRSLIHKTAALDKDSLKYQKNVQRIQGKILHVMSVDKVHGIKLFKYAIKRSVFNGNEKIGKIKIGPSSLSYYKLETNQRKLQYTDKKKYEHNDNEK